MRVLLTGAAGFIGYHAARVLLARGASVVGFDNVNDYYDPAIKRARLAELAARNAFAFVEGDLTDDVALGLAWEAAKPTHVLHLAAQAGVRYSLEAPHTYVQSNLVGFQNVLERVRATRPESFVYASSSSVYGGVAEVPFRETYDVRNPISLYAATKVANEVVAQSYANLFALPTTALRFFTVYGPFGRPDMALYKFAARMLRDETIPVFNQGRMLRDFTYVDDIVDGTLRALEQPKVGAIYNLGRGEPVELLDMIRALEQSLGVEAKLDLLPMQPGDVPRTLACIDRAREDLGYDPQVHIEDGIARFCAWFKPWWDERGGELWAARHGGGSAP